MCAPAFRRECRPYTFSRESKTSEKTRNRPLGADVQLAEARDHELAEEQGKQKQQDEEREQREQDQNRHGSADLGSDWR